jgi:hypothetical protein
MGPIYFTKEQLIAYYWERNKTQPPEHLKMIKSWSPETIEKIALKGYVHVEGIDRYVTEHNWKILQHFAKKPGTEQA